MLPRRRLLSATIAIAGAQALPRLGLAQDRSKPLSGVARIILGFPAGSSSDLIARQYASKLQGRYAETVIVDNRAGAAGRIGIDHLKRAAPDGRTLGLIPVPLMTLYPHVYRKLSYDPLKEFEVGPTIYDGAMGIAVGPSVPAEVTTLAQFVAWAKSQPRPVLFSANGLGTGPHFMGLRLAQRTGVKLEFVPYHGGAQAMQGLLAGDISMVSISMGALAPMARSGRIRILATCGDSRNPFYTEAPTLKELGYADLVEYEWGALYAPLGTPRPVMALLEAAVAEAAAQPDLVASLKNLFVVAAYRDGKETSQALHAGYERYRGIVAASGVRVDD